MNCRRARLQARQQRTERGISRLVTPGSLNSSASTMKVAHCTSSSCQALSQPLKNSNAPGSSSAIRLAQSSGM
jgi:hypothetical protein